MLSSRPHAQPPKFVTLAPELPSRQHDFDEEARRPPMLANIGGGRLGRQRLLTAGQASRQCYVTLALGGAAAKSWVIFRGLPEVLLRW